MKLARYGDIGEEKAGLMDGDTLRDLSAHVADITGDMLDDATLNKLRSLDPSTLPTVSGTPRLGACVGNIGKNSKVFEQRLPPSCVHRRAEQFQLGHTGIVFAKAPLCFAI